MVYTDIAPDVEEEFNRWYNEERLPNRLAIPCVLNTARYVAVKGCPKFLACYELTEHRHCMLILGSTISTTLRGGQSECRPHSSATITSATCT